MKIPVGCAVTRPPRLDGVAWIPRLAALASLAAVAGAIALGAGTARAAVPTPGKPQERAIALVGATIHPVSGPAIAEGTIVFEGGRITALGAGLPVPSGAERLDVSGKHVYPGLVDAYSVLGLTEIGAVRATVDFAEMGNVTPNVQAQVAVNPESELLPVTRSNGVLVALAAPTGGVLSGTSAAMMLDGWTWQDMTLAAPVGLHVNWPGMVIVPPTPGQRETSEERQRENRDRALKNLQAAFDEARAYWTARRAGGGRGIPAHLHDQRWDAMIPVLERKIPLVVNAEEIHQIEAAVAFAQKEKLDLVLYGGYDAPRCAELLAAHDVPVIISAVQRLPRRKSDPYDLPFTLPERLRDAGVRFCIANGGGSWNERNLPYQAATAVAYGLPADEGLKAVTLYPAQLLGLEDRIGSLAAGKDATLIVTDGDPLETATRVERAYIQGRAVDLNDRQKVLYEKYREKYRRQGLAP